MLFRMMEDLTFLQRKSLLQLQKLYFFGAFVTERVKRKGNAKMRIKIECTQQEFAGLVRECVCAEIGGYCHSCLLSLEKDANDGCAGVERIAEIKIIEGGADNG